MIIQPTQSQFNVFFAQWISTRKAKGTEIDFRDYQSEMLWEVIERIGAGKSSLNTTSKFILSACPNAGKTLMAIIYIDWCLYLNPAFRVLVLTHGQVNLKTQFMEEAAKYDADFLKSNNIQIALPHGTHRKDLKKVDLVVVDEAHQFYFAKMMQTILQKTQPDQQLLMTGTPSDFIAHNLTHADDQFDISFIDVKTIFDMGFANNVHVEVASTTYNFGMNPGTFNPHYKGGDFNGEDIPKNEINKMMDYVMDKLRSRLKLNPALYNNRIVSAVALPFSKSKVDAKTMIVARKKEEARWVHEYLLDNGYSKDEVMLSISNDPNGSPELSPFKNDPNIKFLVVVYRGILGFNFSELANIVDLTCSWNINRIFQLYCRLLRKSNTIDTKFYYKVVPEPHLHFFHDFMVAVLHLCHKHFLQMYNGSNFLQMPIRYKGPIREPKTLVNEPVEPVDRPVDIGGRGVKVMPTFDLEAVFELERLWHKGGIPCESKYYGQLSDHINKLSEAERGKWNKVSDTDLMNAGLEFLK